MWNQPNKCVSGAIIIRAPTCTLYLRSELPFQLSSEKSPGELNKGRVRLLKRMNLGKTSKGGGTFSIHKVSTLSLFGVVLSVVGRNSVPDKNSGMYHTSLAAFLPRSNEMCVLVDCRALPLEVRAA